MVVACPVGFLWHGGRGIAHQMEMAIKFML